MASANEIKKRVRDQMADEIRQREDLVVTVVSALEQQRELAASLADAHHKLDDAIQTALTVMSWQDLRKLTAEPNLSRPRKRDLPDPNPPANTGNNETVDVSSIRTDTGTGTETTSADV